MTKINIKDLRGVGDVELNLDDTKRVFVFFGSNGVGKTKTLEALLLLSLKQTKEFDFFPDDYELSKQAMQNQGALEQQQLKNEGQSQNVLDNHNANLLQQFAQNSLQSNEPTQPK